MKNARNKLDTSFEFDCVHCDNCEIQTIKDGGKTSTQLPDGNWSEEMPCNMYKLSCTLDSKEKGYVFSPYETLRPDVCPLSPQKKQTNLFKRIFRSFL